VILLTKGIIHRSEWERPAWLVEPSREKENTKVIVVGRGVVGTKVPRHHREGDWGGGGTRKAGAEQDRHRKKGRRRKIVGRRGPKSKWCAQKSHSGKTRRLSKRRISDFGRGGRIAKALMIVKP